MFVGIYPRTNEHPRGMLGKHHTKESRKKISLGGDLEAHHIFSFSKFPKHRLLEWNGLTLCRNCHKKTF